MRKRQINIRKLSSAALLIVMGLGTALGGVNYSIGTLARMGPGYFPLLLGVLLAFLGLLYIATPDAEEDAMPAPEDESAERPPLPIRPWAATVGSMLVFILVGKYGGLVPATFSLIFIASLGDRANSLLASLLLAGGVTAFAVAVFHYGMQMQFPLFTWG